MTDRELLAGERLTRISRSLGVPSKTCLSAERDENVEDHCVLRGGEKMYVL